MGRHGASASNSADNVVTASVGMGGDSLLSQPAVIPAGAAGGTTSARLQDGRRAAAACESVSVVEVGTVGAGEGAPGCEDKMAPELRWCAVRPAE